MVMRTALILALLTAPAFASAEDDLVACMVGKAAVVLQSEGSKEEALEIAYGGCGLEEATPDQEAAYSKVADYVNLMVERMAAE